MPREQIGMGPDEVRAFLAGQRWMVLGSLDADGSPWADAVCTRLEGERLYFAVSAGSRSLANLRRDPRACCAGDRFPSYYEISGVTVHGRARRVDDAATRRRLLSELSAPEGPVARGPGDEAELYALPLDDVFSFDFGKIQQKY